MRTNSTRDISIFILTANRGANGAGEYIGIASTDEWMSCRGSPIKLMGYPMGWPNPRELVYLGHSVGWPLGS